MADVVAVGQVRAHVVRLVRTLTVAALAGAVSGLLVGGVLGRLAMRCWR